MLGGTNMDKLFAIDGWLYRIGKLIIDLLYMNVLWLAFTLIGCGITLGPATIALFRIMSRRMEDRGNCNYKDFFEAFKKQLWTGIVLGNGILVVVSIIAFNLNNMAFLGELLGNGYLVLFLMALQFLFLIEVATLTVYVFHILARYKVTTSNAIKIALILGHKHLFATVTCVALLGVLMIGFIYVPLMLMIGMSTYGYISAYLLRDKLNNIN